MKCPLVKQKNRRVPYLTPESAGVLKPQATTLVCLNYPALPKTVPVPQIQRDNSVFGSTRCITTYYLQENLEVVSDIDYWTIHRKTGGNQSPAIRSSPDKNALLALLKKMKK